MALDEVVQHTALVWLKEFLTLGGPELLKYSSGYIMAILPCLAYRDEYQRGAESVRIQYPLDSKTLSDIYDAAKQVNITLMKKINEEDKEVEE